MLDKRFLLFLLLSVTIMFGWQALTMPKPDKNAGKNQNAAQNEQQKQDAAGADKEQAAEGEQDKKASADEGEEPVDAATPDFAASPELPVEFATLGSLDPASKFRMLVTITNRGAGVETIEVTHNKYLDVVDRSGYLGYLALSDVAAEPPETGDADSKKESDSRPKTIGCQVSVVGPGTPAAAAGLQVNDVITGIDGEKVTNAAGFHRILSKKRPRQTIELKIKRAGAEQSLTVNLRRRPVSIVRPEYHAHELITTADTEHDPLSFMFTLDSVGDRDFDNLLNSNIDLRKVNWQITDQGDPNLVELTYPVPGTELTAVKRYRLVPGEQTVDVDPHAKAYHLTLEVEVQSSSDKPQEVSYRLNGPTGLPTAGWWFANKVQREWWATGLRDVVRQLEEGDIALMGSDSIAQAIEDKELDKRYSKQGLAIDYMGVDALYFASVLIPNRPEGTNWIAKSGPVAVGSLPQGRDKRLPRKLTNVTCRLVSNKFSVAKDQPLTHSFTVFAGPKQKDLLLKYGPEGRTDDRNLSDLIYFGMALFTVTAKALGWVLGMFSFLPSYGLSIILLTITVRVCMYPISKKQALNAIKMQELAPEMKRISEKYKKDMEKKSKALQEMYKKHNYSPLAGCLPLFIQMPIFIGLYKSLQTNIELRGAPLISDAIRWADNLAAPDMLLRWDGWMFFSDKTGWLGPYLNVLPLFTVALFLWQQKLFTPPPTDEQSAMTQKMMKYMMLFMGLMFFKVPSGLCIYFIASSLWGIGERKLLPKPNRAAPPAPIKAAPKESSKGKNEDSTTNGGGNNKKNRSNKKKGKR